MELYFVRITERTASLRLFAEKNNTMMALNTHTNPDESKCWREEKKIPCVCVFNASVEEGVVCCRQRWEATFLCRFVFQDTSFCSSGAHLRESNVRRMMFSQVSDHRVLERRPAGLKRGHSHLCIPPELVETLNYEVLLRLERDADIYHEISEGFLA